MEKNNMITWFEIPVEDMNRAIGFYSAVFGWKIEIMDVPGCLMAMLPSEGFNMSGALIKHEQYKPSSDGIQIYFYCDEDLIPFVERAEQNGGKIVFPKMKISDEIGYFAFVLDSEGNKIGLHSMK